MGTSENRGILGMSPTKTNTSKSEGHFPAGELPPEEVLFGLSATMHAVRQKVNKIAGMDVPVLLEGEGGTGKEILARWIHSSSPRKSGPFAKVSCAAIPGTLLESELFGFEKGAFTGAVNSKPGRVEMAQGGTLFLDEIAEIDRGLQSKLLQFLQDGRFSRLGDYEEQRAETRVICATNKKLNEEINAGRFRSDLFYRINVVQIQLPKLRERLEDIPILAEYFRNHYMKKFGLEREPMSAEVIRYLQSFSWPGNIRELSNSIARYVLMGKDAVMVPETSTRHATINSVPVPGRPISLKRIAKDAIVDTERNLILEALRANRWNRKRAAHELKISYRALIYKIREAGIGASRTAVQRPRTSPFAAD
jgi:two-component system response regulator AtoC